MEFGRIETEQHPSGVLRAGDIAPPKRRWQRSKIDIRVKIRRWEEPDNAAVVTRSNEMSEGGMSVYAPESLEIGTHVLVEFSLPGNPRRLRLHAVIRNRRGFRSGMEFVELAADDRLLIQRYQKATLAL